MYSKKNVYKYLLPNLLETQRTSFCWFLELGFIQELENFSIIKDYLDELELNLSAQFYTIRQPKYTLAEARRRDNTYSVRIYTQAQLIIIITRGITLNHTKTKSSMSKGTRLMLYK